MSLITMIVTNALTDPTYDSGAAIKAENLVQNIEMDQTHESLQADVIRSLLT